MGWGCMSENNDQTREQRRDKSNREAKRHDAMRFPIRTMHAMSSIDSFVRFFLSFRTVPYRTVPFHFISFHFIPFRCKYDDGICSS